MDSSPPSTLIVGVAIVIVLCAFIIAVFAGWYLSSNPDNTPRIAVQMGELLSACTTTPCDSNLICDSNSFVCKFSAGMTCSDFSDCATGLICSGRCATGATGGLNQLCPCSQGFLCVEQLNGFTLCKAGGGTTCQSGSDCASGDCLSTGVCAAGAPNSFPCTNDIECASLNCNNDFCQASGIITGTRGAACAGACVTFVGAGCSGTIAQPLACECISGTGNPGICVTATQGIISPCSSSLACVDQLACFNTNASSCGSGDTGCLCIFPYTDPNQLAPGVQCINGMSTRPGSLACSNNFQLGCDISGQCVNSACGGPPVLAAYRFSINTIPDLETNFIGATTTSIIPSVFGPNGTIQPRKLFATSGQQVDVIYLVDELQGFYFLQYNPVANIIVTPWMQIIPHTMTSTTGGVSTTRTLIDVGYNGNTFLVAFNETITGGQTGQNDTVYIGSSPLVLTPFNFQPGSGITGTQYTTAGVPLLIEYIDISPANDISPGGDALIAINGTVYVKQTTQTSYSVGVVQGGPMNGTPMTGVTGPVRFYFDNIQNAGLSGPVICPQVGEISSSPIQCPSYYNIAFVGPFNAFGGAVYDQVLQFSGNIAGVAEPTDLFEQTPFHVQYHVFDYSIFSPVPLGMPASSIIMLSSAFASASQGGNFIDNIVNISQGGNTTPFPYRIGQTSRSVTTANAVYVLSIGSCS